MIWLKANLATIIVAIIIVLVISLIIFHLIRQKKQGKSSCGCGCSNCPISGSCHTQKNDDSKKG